MPEEWHPKQGTNTGAVHEELLPMGRTHTEEIHEGLSPMGGTPRWRKGRVSAAPAKEEVVETMCEELTVGPIPHPPVPLGARR